MNSASKKKINLTVIIPTLNNTKGINYLKNYFKDKKYKVVIVDNSKKNLGFAKGVNQGAKKVKTKWMLILNDDIEFKNEKSKSKGESQEIEGLIKFAEENRLDVVSPVLRNPDGDIENVGYQVLPYGKIQLIKNPLSQNLNSPVDGLTAACLLIKTSLFKKLKGFDESFFAYLEDVEFFLRLAKVEDSLPRFAICSQIEVLHNHMTTSKTMGNFKARQDMINWWRLYFKHPDKFKFDLRFLIERLRNFSGYIKASLRIFNF